MSEEQTARKLSVKQQHAINRTSSAVSGGPDPADTESDHSSNKGEDDKPKKSLYEQFIDGNKKQWTMFNVMTTLVSIAMAIGTYFVIAAHDTDCRNLKQTLYLVFVMHIVNSLETLLNIFGLEKKLCTGFWVTMFLIFEITVIVYMQVVYFAAMPSDLATEI